MLCAKLDGKGIAKGGDDFWGTLKYLKDFKKYLFERLCERRNGLFI